MMKCKTVRCKQKDKMLPGGMHRRSPRAPATPSPKPQSYTFDDDEPKMTTTKKILYGLVGLVAVLLISYAIYEHTRELTHEEYEALVPPAPSPPEHHEPYPAPSHDPDEAAAILTRLKTRMDQGKFSKEDYRKMSKKVLKMYPDGKIPPHLQLNPAPEMAEPEDELDMHYRHDKRGKLKNLATNMCLSRGRPFELEDCDHATEFFYNGKMGRIQVLDGSRTPQCLEARTFEVHEGELWTYACHSDGGNQRWTYHPHTHMIKHLHGLCIASSPHKDHGKNPMVSVLPCDHRLSTERWQFQQDV